MPAAVGSAAPAAGPRPAVVVLVAVPDLRWSDLPSMPTLQRLAARGAEADLVVKTAGTTTSCVAGSLAVSAGDRTTGGSVSGCSVTPAQLSALTVANRRGHFAAQVGALGDALDRAGVPVTAVGRPAVPLVAGGSGRTVVGSRASAGIARGGLTAVLDDGLYGRSGLARRAAALGVDARLRSVAAAVPAGGVLMVAGTSDGPTGGRHLHVLVVSGPGWPHRDLDSPLTRRPPYVELIDLSPTLLRLAGVTPPSTMSGRAMQPSSAPAAAPSRYVDDDRHARAAPSLAFRGTLTWLVFSLIVLAASGIPLVLRATPWLARLLAPLAVLSFLVNALPWWRWGNPWFGALLTLAAVVVASSVALVRARSRTAALLVVPVLGVVVLVLDQLAGSPLQLSAPLGDDPLTAGRFAGLGNLGFAVLAACGLLTAGLLAGLRLAAGRRRPAAVAVAAAVMAVVLVVDAAPPLGDDFGGALALLPATGLLLALLGGIRVTWRRLALLAAGTVVAAAGLAAADYARPAQRQTHVGRFAGQVVHGGAAAVLHRKVDAVVGSAGLNAATILLATALAAGWWHRRRIVESLRAVDGLWEASLALVVAAVLGSLLNDSGTVVAAMAISVAVPTCYGVLAGPRSGLTRRRPPLPPPRGAVTAP